MKVACSNFLCVFVFVYCMCGVLYGKDQKVTISADEETYHQQEEYWDLIGNASFKHGQNLIYAESMKYFKGQEKVVGLGHVKILDKEQATEVYSNYGEYAVKTQYLKLRDNVRIHLIKDNILVFGKVLERFMTAKTIVIHDEVRVVLSTNNATIQCQKAVYDLDREEIVFTEGVSISHKDAVYTADSIVFRVDARELVFNQNAQIQTSQYIIRSTFMYYYPDRTLEQLVFVGKPKFQEYSRKDSVLEGKPFRIVQAERVVYNNEAQRSFYFVGKVVSEEYYLESSRRKEGWRDVAVYSQKLFADEIRYYQDADVRYECIGNVTMYHPEVSVYAGYANYNAVLDRFLLRDDPVVYKHVEKNTRMHNAVEYKMKGRQIVYEQKDARLIMQDNASVIGSDGVLHADRIEFLRDVSELHAQGHAIYDGKDGYARAERISVQGEDQEKVYLLGSAFYEDEEFKSSAGFIEYLRNKDIVTLKENAAVYHKEKKKSIYAHKIVYSEKSKDKRVEAEGGVRVVGEDEEVWGNQLEYRYGKKEEEDTLTMRGRGKLIKDEMTVYADRLVYHKLPKGMSQYDSKILVFEHVRIEDKDRILKGREGEYLFDDTNDAKDSQGYLTGPCEIIARHKMNQIYARRIEYSKVNKRERYLLHGQVEASYEDKAAYADMMLFLPEYEVGVDQLTLLASPRIEDATHRLYGQRIEIYDKEYDEIKVFEKGVYVNDDEEVEVRGDLLTYDEKTEVLTGVGNPIFMGKEDKVSISGGILKYFSKDSVAVGTDSVKIIQEDLQLFGDYVKYEKPQQILTLQGDASVVREDSVTKAKTIILNTKKRTVELSELEDSRIDIGSS